MRWGGPPCCTRPRRSCSARMRSALCAGPHCCRHFEFSSIMPSPAPPLHSSRSTRFRESSSPIKRSNVRALSAALGSERVGKGHTWRGWGRRQRFELGWGRGGGRSPPLAIGQRQSVVGKGGWCCRSPRLRRRPDRQIRDARLTLAAAVCTRPCSEDGRRACSPPDHPTPAPRLNPIPHGGTHLERQLPGQVAQGEIGGLKL